MTGRFLDPPVSLLDVEVGRDLTFRVERAELGNIILPPRSPFASGVVECLRLYLPEGDDVAGPGHWDITSRQLRAALEPLLPWIIDHRRRVRIRALGTPPRVAYTVDLVV